MTLESKITVKNLVLSGKLELELDLQAISDGLGDSVEYNPGVFPASIYNKGTDKPTVIAFRTGTITCTGAKDESEGYSAIGEFLKRLELEDAEWEEDLAVQNIVSIGSLGENMNLPNVAVGLGLENAEYEPEQFPGLIYKIDEPHVSFLIFTSGEVVITGARTKAEAETGFKKLVENLGDFGLLS